MDFQGPTLLSPALPKEKLPPEERDRAIFIERMLHDLGRRCADFDAAVKLFDYCIEFLQGQPHYNLHSEECQLRWYWRSFAAREAAATLYRASETMEHAGKNLGKCPVLQKMVDHTVKRAATKAFKTHFPGVEGIRHASQHYAKLYGTPESLSAHAISGEVNFINSLDGRTVRTIYERRQVTLEISEDSSQKLREVRDLYWAAYMAALDQ